MLLRGLIACMSMSDLADEFCNLHDAHLALSAGWGLELDEPDDGLRPIKTEGVEGEASIIYGGGF